MRPLRYEEVIYSLQSAVDGYDAFKVLRLIPIDKCYSYTNWLNSMGTAEESFAGSWIDVFGRRHVSMKGRYPCGFG